MRITLNNRSDEIKQSPLTVSELLKLKNYTFKLLVIKINGKLVKKDEYDQAEIIDGDNVAVIHLISGG